MFHFPRVNSLASIYRVDFVSKVTSEHLLLLSQVAVHYDGKFYEFVPWEGKVEWEIAPWGSWKMTAQTRTYEVRVVWSPLSTTVARSIRTPSKDHITSSSDVRFM